MVYETVSLKVENAAGFRLSWGIVSEGHIQHNFFATTVQCLLQDPMLGTLAMTAEW
jgi:hypothetical protein